MFLGAPEHLKFLRYKTLSTHRQYAIVTYPSPLMCYPLCNSFFDDELDQLLDDLADEIAHADHDLLGDAVAEHEQRGDTTPVDAIDE